MTSVARADAPVAALFAGLLSGSPLIADAVAYAAAAWQRLGAADALEEGPRSAEEVAERIGADPDALRRLLRALTTVGLVAEPSPDRFAHGPLARFATAAAGPTPDSAPGWYWQAWEALDEAVRSGRTAFECAHGIPLFEYLARHPEAATAFDRSMTALHGDRNAEVAQEVWLGDVRKLVDVGGGEGDLLAAMLDAHPRLRGALVERPDVLDRARPKLAAAGVLGRCELVSGDFFAQLPEGGDVYLLASVLHDWDDERAGAILARCREAMGDDGRLIVVEMALPPAGVSSQALFLDLTMLVLTGGRERSPGEMAALAAGAGLEHQYTARTASGWHAYLLGIA